MKPDNIILTGFMGTGKSAVGRELARRLGWPFVDMDRIIAEKEGRSIADIFAQNGESHFRDVETLVCHNLTAQRGQVIATGGGTVLREENRAILASAGMLICLNASVDEILRRIGESPHRPLLAGGDKRKRVEALLQARQAAYAAIPLQVDTTGLTTRQVVDQILERLGQ